MKRTILVLVAALASSSAFAVELDLLFDAFYKGDVTAMRGDDLLIENFDAGAEMRLKFGIFRFDAGMASFPTEQGSELSLPLDFGLSLDLLFLRAGAGVGPLFAFGGGEGMAQRGYNIKASADLLLGGLDLGLVAYQTADAFDALFDYSALSDLGRWKVGASLGFRF